MYLAQFYSEQFGPENRERGAMANMLFSTFIDLKIFENKIQNGEFAVKTRCGSLVRPYLASHDTLWK